MQSQQAQIPKKKPDQSYFFVEICLPDLLKELAPQLAANAQQIKLHPYYTKLEDIEKQEIFWVVNKINKQSLDKEPMLVFSTKIEEEVNLKSKEVKRLAIVNHYQIITPRELSLKAKFGLMAEVIPWVIQTFHVKKLRFKMQPGFKEISQTLGISGITSAYFSLSSKNLYRTFFSFDRRLVMSPKL